MNIKMPKPFMGLARRPLVAGLAWASAVAGGFVATDTCATILTVDSCSDSGPGSLRTIVGGAMSGDTVKFSAALACSTITLTSGAIVVLQNNLTLDGPGANALAIDGGGVHRVIEHDGAGTLTIDDLTITHGRDQSSTGYAAGGCMFSTSNITMTNSTVSLCLANGLSGVSAYGGGILVHGNLYLTNSTITQNFVTGSGVRERGGGAFVAGNLIAIDSTISNNLAETSAQHGEGGGLFTYGSALVGSTTISGNRADSFAGWAALEAVTVSTNEVEIVNSTISGNIASDQTGGIGTVLPLYLSNSTIAFNESGLDPYGAGLYSNGAALTLQSSIVADNTEFYSGAPSDLSGPIGTPVIGANNLITSGHGVVFPRGTITSCPKLGPLADNGGPTQTHALLHTSFAIDTGNNSQGLTYDQRGKPHPREYGFAADIGAYEWQGNADDRLFVSGFEVACDH